MNIELLGTLDLSGKYIRIIQSIHYQQVAFTWIENEQGQFFFYSFRFKQGNKATKSRGGGSTECERI